ncbi:MAG: hypothetical protein ACE5KJ_06160, partial [Candidatus Zixiibacteriota bacterium]
GTSQSGDRVTFTDTYNANSGIRVLRTKVRCAYSKSIGRTKTSTGDTKNTSTTFPDFDFTLSNVGKIWLLEKIIHNSSYKFDYNKKVDKSEKERTGELINETTSEKFSHFLTFTHNWKGGAQTSLTIKRDYNNNWSLQGVGQNRNATKSYRNTITLSNSYSFRAPHGIKIPLLRKIKFTSQLNLSLNIAITNDKQKRSVGGKGYNIVKDHSQLSIKTTSGYSFSKQVTGGFNATWLDSNDKITKRKRHTRELGIWLTLKF